ncbi:diaminohydroxyphosphoribosylaminopyrimidine deaminase [Advenella kashmirensis W13003]|uniref:Riboflavin biosynthesis protein RibD n=1 Tax=Advenella kashmirensis W13003 TaxID=1424334 RepID=V8QPZ1_9BURK|nr:bifunctional diaminohydroxyphosphoribosylaminopyrimidine deaminase/5-amino-6-(5-phosphoribosylamino)uracil reductase RibD [Advenella kashmirensis]ETF01049.1 diaminohydroxyphosphoribosylaminopyrimidine deaminase [Advenella kashmirensis W13003]
MTDQDYMNRALELARSVMVSTSPNPRVGCVIVSNGQILGEGATQPPGGPHAEVCAIRDAQQKGHELRGTTFYVTLEPCSHYGRTPPCVDALLAVEPARVVIAARDPNPLVSGAGIRKLQEAGIIVDLGLGLEQALEINPGFVSRMSIQRPWVRMKIASTLDGKVALNNGRSQWITGSAARLDGHHWRARACVILTGSGTVRDDDPLLTVRGVDTPRQPVRAVIDSQFAIDEDARLFDGGPVWIFVTEYNADKAARLAARNVRVITVAEKNNHVDLKAVMAWLGQQDINEVHVEAGPGLNGALLQAGCVDELLVYMAPKILGEARSAVAHRPFTVLADAYQFAFFDTTACGDDLRLRARLPMRWNQLQLQSGATPTSDTE